MKSKAWILLILTMILVTVWAKPNSYQYQRKKNYYQQKNLHGQYGHYHRRHQYSNQNYNGRKVGVYSNNHRNDHYGYFKHSVYH